MTLRHPDPFSDPTQGLKTEVNPYVQFLQDGLATGDLPVSYGPDLKAMIGNWRQRCTEQMGREPDQLIVEIGCHKGRIICEMAEKHPNTAFIGLDITFKRVVTTARRAKNHGLKNIVSVLANGIALDKLFAVEEIDGLVMFFPDPWSKKKRQRRKRLFNGKFADLLVPLIRKDGFVWFKSDQEDYVVDARALVAERGFTPMENPTGLLSESYVSTFESLFTKQNLPTFGFQWEKTADFQEQQGKNEALGTSPLVI